jgi:hypothetical protein
VFLDECGFSLNLHRLYGWVIGGGRCQENVPFNRGTNRSVVGAFSLPSESNPTGMLALWQKDGAWNQVLFECFVEIAVLPLVPQGSVLVLDNARIHHNPSLFLPDRIGLELDQSLRPQFRATRSRYPD